MKTILIVVTWLTVGPQVSTSELNSESACRTALKVTAEMLQRQSSSNLTGPHGPLQLEKDPAPGLNEWVLRTATVGREVVRLSCVGAG